MIKLVFCVIKTLNLYIFSKKFLIDMANEKFISLLKEQNWPQEFYEKLKIGDLQSNVGIATLWTFKEVVFKELDPSFYAVVGNFYDRQNGLEPLIRNCLANPNIRYILIVGNDKAKSKEVLVNFFEKGVFEGKVFGTETKIPKEIPLEEIEKLRKNVKIFDLTNKIKNFEEPKEYSKIIK